MPALALRFMNDLVRGYVQLLHVVILVSSIGILYPLVAAAAVVAVLCKLWADQRLLSVALSEDTLRCMTGARGVPTLGIVSTVFISIACIALFAAFGQLSGAFEFTATTVLPPACCALLLLAEGAVRRWWRRQPLPMDSSALYGSARLRQHLFSRGRRMRIAHEASQSTLSSKGSGDGRSRGASVLPDDAAVGEHNHAAASSTALLKAAVRRSYYTADA